MRCTPMERETGSQPGVIPQAADQAGAYHTRLPPSPQRPFLEKSEGRRAPSARIVSAMPLRLLVALTALLVAGCAHAPRPVAPSFVRPSFTEELALREAWTAKKHARLLPMMRQHGMDMWIVVHEEFNEDPVTEFIAGPRPLAGGRDLFVFVDGKERGLLSYAITGYTEENLTRFFQTPFEPGKGDWMSAALAKLVADHSPNRIALAMRGARGAERSLTHDAFLFITGALGPDAAAKLVPAGPLIEEYLDTRLPEELEPYQRLSQLTADLVARAFSREVITPGKTTIGDVRRFLYDEVRRHGVETWFQPDLRLQREGTPNRMSRGFLAVALEEQVIERGDLLHVDFGLRALGLNTDYQRMAYVLREGETAAPAGLTAALQNTVALQDAVMGTARPGMSAAEVYASAMAQMKARGIEAQIYSHPLGHHGHGLGPTIDFRSAQRSLQPDARPPSPLRPGSWIAIELNTQSAVPEWGGQKVFMMEEDPAHLTDEGYRFFVARQRELILIGP